MPGGVCPKHLHGLPALLLTFVPFAVGNSFNWIKAGNGSDAVCAGAMNSCSDISSCTTVAVGACSEVAPPASYFEISIVGLAMVEGDDQAYLSNDSKLSSLTAASVSNNRYRELDDAETVGNATYASLRSGAFYGAPATAGAFIGMAAYVLTNGTISTNMMPVVVPSAAGSTTTQEQTLCIAALTAGTCGDSLRFSSGSFKYSMFSYTMGSSFNVDSK